LPTFYRFSFALPSLFLRFKAGTTTSDSVKPVCNKPTPLPHAERDTGEETERTFCKVDESLMQAWSEDGTALVRGRSRTLTENVNKNPDDTVIKLTGKIAFLICT